MIRYPAFDPPEYVDWAPDPPILEEYKSTLDRDPRKRELSRSLTSEQLLGLYEGLLRNRLHDVALKRWVKQGVISKAWLGTGEEASTIGPVHALNRIHSREIEPDIVAPMIRNAGACHEMGMSVADMLRGYLGTEDGPARGRDLHIGDFDRGVLAPISHVGDSMAVAVGVALAFKMKRIPRVVLTWIGDGSTKIGVFHEAMNLAAVQRLPIIVIVQNNQVALGTRLDQHQRGSFDDWPAAYGVSGDRFDGNHVLDAYSSIKLAVEDCRAGGGPWLIVAETFRMAGHATHDEREARTTFSPELFEKWGKHDPIGLFEAYLAEGTLDLESGRRARRTPAMRARNTIMLASIEQRVIAEIDRAAVEALESSRTRMPVPESAADGVYGDELPVGMDPATAAR
jgi:TPP-dependent pyruvate/acetoin dehydrogenase alpha subunit